MAPPEHPAGTRPEPSEPTASPTGRSRAAVGRRLLTERDGPWSALPIEWSRATQADRVAEASGDRDVEQLPGMAWRLAYTLIQLLRRPLGSFARVDEPVSHGAVIGFLAAVRIPLWLVLLGWLGVTGYAGADGPIRPIHDTLDPELAEALVLWLILLVPAGVPALYFFNGLFSHVALVLTGGAPRSLAATMRGTGYALAPVLLLVSILDLLLYQVGVGFVPMITATAVIWLLYFVQLGFALTGTHRIPAIRGFLVALIPAGLPILILLGRAMLVVTDMPGWQPPVTTSFFVP